MPAGSADHSPAVAVGNTLAESAAGSNQAGAAGNNPAESAAGSSPAESAPGNSPAESAAGSSPADIAGNCRLERRKCAVGSARPLEGHARAARRERVHTSRPPCQVQPRGTSVRLLRRRRRGSQLHARRRQRGTAKALCEGVVARYERAENGENGGHPPWRNETLHITDSWWLGSETSRTDRRTVLRAIGP